jgi:brefeldin A-resistance guanine nucleotide exchange factor 1
LSSSCGLDCANENIDVKTFDTPALLHPFLQVIRSSSTSASITSLALIAVTKFLSYSVISRDSPRLPYAMQNLAAAITHCRFEASSTSADEVVYVRILKLMEALISGPGGDILSDESVCQIMETGLGLCCDQRFTQILQRSAEITMVSMCQIIFERLKHLEFEAGDEPGALDEVTKDDMDTVKMDMEPTANGSSTLAPEISINGGERSSNSVETRENLDKSQELQPLLSEKQAEDPNSSTVDLGTTSDDDEPAIKPYSLPSIKELFRSLVELLDPHDKTYTDTMRVMALRIVDVALEVAGPSIASHPSLASLAKDTLCRHLFQLVRSENMAILNESLRVAGTLLATCRNVLKLQQELYLSYLVACLFPRVTIPQEPGIDPRLYEGVPQAPGLIKPAPTQQGGGGNGRATPVPVRDRQRLGLEGGSRKPDAREAMVESIGALVRMPTFMAELFVNYDCQVDRNDICADMVGLLSRNAFPDSATWSTTNVPPLCLDALLGFVQTMADRLDDEPITEGFPSAEQLRKQRDLKATIIKGTSKFNESPKAGIAFLASHGVISSVDDPKAIAQFIQGSSRLDKKVLGDFISKSSNDKILIAFLEAFDFKGKTVEESLREVLYTFRLPGESQLIERIVVEFAKKYVGDGNNDNIATEDAIFVLTYAIIMLNTDQHNPNVKNGQRMQLENFARNLRGVNDNKDFDLEYLESIFISIKTKEIVLPEEHSNKDAFGHAWKELLVKVDTASDLVICNTNIFDADMFAATWKPIVATLSYVFMSASEDAVFSRVFTGFAQCAQIAARHGLSDALDKIVFSLSSISTLATATLPNTSLNTEVQANEKSVMVSETAVRFGRDDRAQQATVVLFRVLEGNEATLRDGWEYVFRIMLNLFINSLIPASFKSKHLDLPAIPLQPPAQVIDRGERHSEGGLFSGLSSYLSSFANDEPPEPSEQEIENTLAAVDCIGQCDFEELIERLG